MSPSRLAVSRTLLNAIPGTRDIHTVQSLFRWIGSLVVQFPEMGKHLEARARLIGVAGLVLLAVAVFYSVVWRKRILQKLEEELQPLLKRTSAQTYPRLVALIRVLIAPLLPLVFLGLFMGIQHLIRYESGWFSFLIRVLALWGAEALVLGFLREYLIDGLLPHCPLYGKTLLRSISLILVYMGAGLAVLWAVEAGRAPRDVQALLRLVFRLSSVCFLSLLLLRKKELLSLLPRLPYKSHSAFIRFLDRAYPGLVLLTVATGLLWCVGDRNLALTILKRTWGVAAVYVAIMASYHFVFELLRRWSKKKLHPEDEAVKFFSRSAKAVLKLAAFLAATFAIFDLLGLLSPLLYVVSTPFLTVMNTSLSITVLIEAGAALFIAIYASKVIRVYLDYKVYPSMGVDTGLAYAINTFLHYLFIAAGILIALRIAGLDLRVLMVFAGGLGIGAGLGLQEIAGNIVSGFILVFGRKLRKGDWIRIENKLGRVTHIYLRATKLWTYDNIEYLIPNSDLVSKQIVNYTLTSPIVRIHVPVGASYDAAPQQVRKILLECAEKHQVVMQFRKPEVRLVEFGDSSVNFELLVWIDVSRAVEGEIKSRLYFTIFDAFGQAGIKIPYPQRDVHFDTALHAASGAEDKGGPEQGR